MAVLLRGCAQHADCLLEVALQAERAPEVQRGERHERPGLRGVLRRLPVERQGGRGVLRAAPADAAAPGEEQEGARVSLFRALGGVGECQGGLWGGEGAEGAEGGALVELGEEPGGGEEGEGGGGAREERQRGGGVGGGQREAQQQALRQAVQRDAERGGRSRGGVVRRVRGDDFAKERDGFGREVRGAEAEEVAVGEVDERVGALPGGEREGPAVGKKGKARRSR